MLNNITTIENLEREAEDIQKFLEVNCSEDANEAAERGDQLNVYMARTAKMLADARLWQDEAIMVQTNLACQTYPSMPASTRNRLIESMCKRENYLVTWIERLNRACTHQQSFMITLISKAKAEMQMNNYAGNVRNNSGGAPW